MAPKQTNTPKQDIVVIGASADGIAAMKNRACKQAGEAEQGAAAIQD